MAASQKDVCPCLSGASLHGTDCVVLRCLLAEVACTCDSTLALFVLKDNWLAPRQKVRSVEVFGHGE